MPCPWFQIKTGQSWWKVIFLAIFLYLFSAKQKQPPKVFHKKLLLKISQYSQDNTSVGVSFNKVAGLQNYNFNKEQTPTQVYQRTAASSKAFIKKKCCIVNIQIYKYTNIYKHTNVFDWRTKSPLVSVQNKHSYLLISINKLNFSKAKKNEKSGDTVQQI